MIHPRPRCLKKTLPDSFFCIFVHASLCIEELHVTINIIYYRSWLVEESGNSGYAVFALLRTSSACNVCFLDHMQFDEKRSINAQIN